MELYIIRHAQSENNALGDDFNNRVKDPQLTDTGLIQADYVAQYLATATNLESVVRIPAGEATRAEYHKIHITHLYTSAMCRALQTSRPISKALGLPVEIWLEIHEHGGIWLNENGVSRGFGGMTRSQIYDAFPDYIIPDEVTEDGWWKPEDGEEHITLCYARAMRVAHALRSRAMSDKGREDSVAIVTHGTFIDGLIKALLGRLPTREYFHWHYNTAITRLDLTQDGTIIIRYINRITHLTPELVT